MNSLHTPPNRKSLVGQLLDVMLTMAHRLGEQEVRHQWLAARTTALEQRMDTMPPRRRPEPAPPPSSGPHWGWSTEGLLRALGSVWRLAKVLPWGLVLGWASFLGAAVWQWLGPLFQRLLPWLL
jgi:hypothetical protein